MKKLLIVFLVLAMASAASAYSVGWRVAPDDAKDDYTPSDTITIELYTDDPDIVGLLIDAVADDDDYGTAHEPLTLHSNFTTVAEVGDIVNTGAPVNILIELISATAGVGTSATGILYSFEYHVPEKDPSTIITISDYYDWDAGYFEAEVENGDGYIYGPAGDYAIDALEIHIIPEPATIALLGLGGLLLRRRK